MRAFRLLWLLLLALIGLAACSSATEQTALPLAEDKPTFILFYTDN